MKVQDVLLKAMAKRISWLAAAEIIGVTPRMMRRWRERLEEHGYSGLADRRKGKASLRRVPLKTAEEVLKLYQEKYYDLNVRHFREKLRDVHGIDLSYTWIYQALLGAGLVQKRRKRAPHRRRRERRPLPGMLLHIPAPVANRPRSFGSQAPSFGMWQGRLPQELRLAGISTSEEANRFLRAVHPRVQRELQRASRGEGDSVSAAQPDRPQLGFHRADGTCGGQIQHGRDRESTLANRKSPVPAYPCGEHSNDPRASGWDGFDPLRAACGGALHQGRRKAGQHANGTAPWKRRRADYGLYPVKGKSDTQGGGLTAALYPVKRTDRVLIL